MCCIGFASLWQDAWENQLQKEAYCCFRGFWPLWLGSITVGLRWGDHHGGDCGSCKAFQLPVPGGSRQEAGRGGCVDRACPSILLSDRLHSYSPQHLPRAPQLGIQPSLCQSSGYIFDPDCDACPNPSVGFHQLLCSNLRCLDRRLEPGPGKCLWAGQESMEWPTAKILPHDA